MNSIFTRRSIRRFLPREVEAEKLDRLLRAGMQAPSGKDTRPWEFLVVRDAEARLAISQMSEYAGMCRYAPLLIITLADMNRAQQWWPQDMAACTQNILLQAVEEGLGAVWLGFYPVEERVTKTREYFSLPDNLIPFSVIAVGYSERENKFIDRYDAARVHYEKW